MPELEVELRAAAAVAFVVGGRYRQLDVPGAPSGTRDFDLIFDERNPEPLEITLAMIEQMRQTSERISAKDTTAPSLSHSWVLHIPSMERLPSGDPGSYDVDRLFRAIVTVLKVFEGLGIERLDVAADRRSAPVGTPLRAAYDALFRHGVTMGLPLDPLPGESPRIHLKSTTSSSGYGASIRCVVLAEARKADNLKKLEEPADATDRHLCVVVSLNVGRAGWALFSDGEAGDAPDSLPAPITTAWAMSGRWIASVKPPQGWVTERIPDDVFEHPEHLAA
jgi:hypothetical protein